VKLKDAQSAILGVLYSCREIGNIGFIGLSSIFKIIKYNFNQEIVFDTGKYFEAKGYVQLLSSIDDVYVQIATQGILYVEELIERGEIKQDYVKEIAKALSKNIISKKELQNPRGIKERRKGIIKILDSLKSKIGKGMDPESYDLRIDIDILKMEMKKIVPDQDIIKSKLNQFDIQNRYFHEISKIKNNINLY